MQAKNKQILFAVVMGAVAVTTTYLYIQKATKKSSADEMVKVVVLSQSVQAGSQFHPGVYTSRTVSKASAPTSYIAYNDVDSYVGEAFAVNMLKGDYVTRTSFQARRMVADSLSAGISGPQARGVTIPVSETSSLAGSIVPGDTVDILYSFDVPGTPEQMTTLLLQNVAVIATGTYSPETQEYDPSSSSRYSTVTLLLSLVDAVRLKSAQRLGNIDMLLRSRGDAETASLQPVSGNKDILNESDRARLDAMLAEVEAKTASAATAAANSTPLDDALLRRLKEAGAIAGRGN